MKFVSGFTRLRKTHTVRVEREVQEEELCPIQLDLVFRAPPVCQALHWGLGYSRDKEQLLESLSGRGQKGQTTWRDAK